MFPVSHLPPSLIGEEESLNRFPLDDVLFQYLGDRALNDLNSKKKVLALVFADGVDDLIPMLGELDRSDLLEFRDNVNCQVTNVVFAIGQATKKWGGLDRKTYAALVQDNVDKKLLNAMFVAYDKKDVRAAVKEMFTKYIDMINAEWRGQ